MNKSLTIIRQHVGIDISKSDLMASIAIQKPDFSVGIVSTKKFSNNISGFENLLSWATSFSNPDLPLSFTMEATGVYYEPLAYWLYENQISVSVQLAKQVKHYGQSLNIKTKSDESDAKVIAMMGVERKLKQWNPHSATLRQIKLLDREKESLIAERTIVKNQLHATTHGYQPPLNIIQRLQKRIEFITNQILEIEKEIKTFVQNDTILTEKIDNVCTIKGISFTTAITIIAETNGFALVDNQRQVVSYAGYDVVQNQSGSSLNGKTKISKRGNKKIRKALYFPAISATQHDVKHKAIASKIAEKTSIKMKGCVAIQRRLLVLIYTLFKNNEQYNPDYKTKKTNEKIRQNQTETCSA